MDRHLDKMLLNAYVDGELDGEEAARVERAMATDSVVASEVSVLRKLKAATAEAIETREITLPRPARFWRGRWVAAASVLFVLLGVGLFWQLSGLPRDVTGFERAAHASWASGTTAFSGDFRLEIANADGVLARAYNPDLSSAELTLVHLQIWRPSDGAVLVLGYAGTRGCRLTFLAHPSAGTDAAEMSKLAAGRLQVARWSTGGFDYALVAEGMAGVRFDSIVEGVHKASLRHAPIGQEDRYAMGRARAASPPCAVG